MASVVPVLGSLLQSPQARHERVLCQLCSRPRYRLPAGDGLGNPGSRRQTQWQHPCSFGSLVQPAVIVGGADAPELVADHQVPLRHGYYLRRWRRTADDGRLAVDGGAGYGDRRLETREMVWPVEDVFWSRPLSQVLEGLAHRALR